MSGSGPRAAALAQTRLALALLLLCPLLAAGCGTAGTKLPVSEMTARTNSDGVQIVDVDVHSFYFKPNRIVVDEGRPVDITLHFKSFFVPHNFTCIDGDAGISVSRGAGFMSFSRTKHATFTPTKAGEYEFFCHVDGHHKKGMEGTLVVRPRPRRR
jgi:plastocyanin